ncbi:MAG TPA: NAD(P)/FAD-dependent oxidoreductase [Thermoanaerobaculia bacterium]|nr:NAD(P)/FAD-dependent oxidoreductase [Thermoanaerobaculia bacterium]
MAGAADLLVVGGGPAGLATAIQARLAGLTVRLVERSRPPIDKACGEGLMPDAVERLRALGVEVAPVSAAEAREGTRAPDEARVETRIPGGEAFPFRGIRYIDGATVAEGLFPRAAVGLGIRRLWLHQALVRRAEQAGVELCWGVRVLGLEAAGARTEAGLLPARWIAGADGLRSQVRRWIGLEGRPAASRRFGVRRHYAVRPWSDFVEVYWGPGCEAYVTPVGRELVGVAILWSGGKSRFAALLRCFPELERRLAAAPLASRDRGAGPLLQTARGVWRGNVALVGDASGYLDAITGEGLAVALHQSAALAEALRGGDLSGYAAAHRRIGRLPGNLTALVLALERRPWLRRRAVRALAAEPALFSRLLGIHGRILPPRRLGVDGALRLALRLVTA